MIAADGRTAWIRECGTVLVETKGFNQDGKEVCYFRRRVMVWKREFAPGRQRPYDGQDVWAG